MTDDTDTTSEPADGQPIDDTDAASEGTRPDGGGGRFAIGSGEADVREYLLKGSLLLMAVLGVVATLQFYLSAQTAIQRFATAEFRPVFVAAFNLVVLLVVGVGIAQVVRRLG